MTDEMMKEKIFSLGQTEARQERMINDLLHCMVDLDLHTFEEIIDEYIYTNGIDKSITQLIFPFLNRIGILWITDHIKVAQEHLITNLIRQKFIMGIENASPLQKASKTIVLFLPEGEHHELGLLYVHYLLKIRGIEVLYLGADVPVDDLEFVCRIKHPNFLFSHLTSIPPKLNLEKYLTDIRTRIKDTPLVLSGRVSSSYHRKIPSGIAVKHSVEEVLEHLAN
jgi:methanogenic corrinoid protein MtbC1